MNEIEAVGDEASMRPPERDSGVGGARPWLYSLLIAPAAIVANGVIQGGVLAYLLSAQGIGAGRQAHIIWLLALPTSLYFLWSPVTDFLVRRRTWLLIGGLAAAALMAEAFRQGSLISTRAMVLFFAAACAGQLGISSCGGMMGTIGDERARRVAGSFYQAGSMAFGAAAVSVLVWMSGRVGMDRLGLSRLGLIAGGLIALPTVFALAAPREQRMAGGDFAGAMRRMWGEFKATFLRWDAVPYTLCLVFPMASGAAVGLLPGQARFYGVNGDSVAWMNGLLGTLLMAAGSLAATLVPARVRAAVAYLSMSLVNAAALGVLWLGPLRPSTYFAGVTTYLFTVGICYALFTAVVLEFLGHSGASGSGRYSIINSLGNVPVLYMLQLDGWGGDRWGARGLAGTEAVVSAVGGALLLGYFLTRKGVIAAEDGAVAGH
jgi:MFS transporter, PAT family, beta-lactamase induction signal transducer AmpG